MNGSQHHGAADEPQWRIQVDRRACVGSGICVATAPEHFQLVDNRSHPIHELSRPDAAVADAAACCPAEAISIRDAATGEPVEI